MIADSGHLVLSHLCRGGDDGDRVGGSHSVMLGGCSHSILCGNQGLSGGECLFVQFGYR